MIVEDIKALEQKLLGGENAAALRALADTEEARRLGRVIDSREAEQALRSGDSAQMCSGFWIYSSVRNSIR